MIYYVLQIFYHHLLFHFAYVQKFIFHFLVIKFLNIFWLYMDFDSPKAFSYTQIVKRYSSMYSWSAHKVS